MRLYVLLVALLGGCDVKLDSWHASGSNESFYANWLKQSSDLWANYLFENGEGFACGINGVIMYTRDLGKTWQQRTTPVTTGLLDITFTSRSVGFAAGYSGILLATKDGGVSWTVIPLQTTSTLRRFGSLDSSTGWLVGDDGLMYKTTDGGVHWARILDPAIGNASLEDIHFVDSMRGLVVGAYGFMAVTSDGGKTWTRKPASKSCALNRIASDGSEVWVVGNCGTVLHSTDGGAGWTIEPVPTSDALRDVRTFRDRVSGRHVVLAVGSYGLILKLEGGAWSRMTMQPAEVLNSIAGSSERIWIVGFGSASVSSKDLGTTWELDAAAWHPTLFDIAATDHSVLAAGRYGLVTRSTDHGQTWHQETLGAMLTVAATHGRDAWLAGLDGYVVYSSNDGEDWTRVRTPVEVNLHAIDATSDGQVWIGGERGVLLHGRADQPLTSQVVGARTFSALCFADPSTGWALQVGTIFHTVDGGASWSELAVPVSAAEQITTLACIRGLSQDLWALTSAGNVYMTRSSGKQWRASAIGNKSIGVMRFSDEDHGWAVGTNAWIFSTIDGGASWQPVDNTISAGLYGLSIVDQSHILAVGDGGVLMTASRGSADTDWTDISNDFEDVAWSDPDHVWVVGGQGTVLMSQDRGATYQIMGSPTSDVIKYVKFSTTKNGWLGTPDGTIFHTGDAGASWQKIGVVKELKEIDGIAQADAWAVSGAGQLVRLTMDGGLQPIDTGSMFSKVEWTSLSFVDKLHGYAVGGSGRIGWVAATRDGGISWQPLASIDMFPIHVCFVDVANGYVVGNKGAMRATSDGGVTWRQVTVGTNDALSDVVFYNDSVGWVLGDHGIFSTMDGGNSWRFDEHGMSYVGRLAIAPPSSSAEPVGIFVGGDHAIFRNAGIDRVPRASSLDVAETGDMVALTWTIDDEDPEGVEVTTVKYQKWQQGVWVSAPVKVKRDGPRVIATWNPSEHPDNVAPGTPLNYRIELHDKHSVAATTAAQSYVYMPWWTRQPAWIQDAVIVLVVMACYSLLCVCLVLFAPQVIVHAIPLARVVEFIPVSWSIVSVPLRLLVQLCTATWFARLPRVQVAWTRTRVRWLSQVSKLPVSLHAGFLENACVLDRLVGSALQEARTQLEARLSIQQRRRYIPIAVQFGAGDPVPEMTLERARRRMTRTSKLTITGAGGAGKSTLAFALARWAMASSSEARLFEYPVIAVVIEDDPVESLSTHVEDAVAQILRNVETDATTRQTVARALVARSRVFIVLDSVSEWSLDSQRQAQALLHSLPDAPMVITTRGDQLDGSVAWQIGGFSASMIVRLVEAFSHPAIQAAAAQREALRLAERVLDLVSLTVGTSANPLLVRLVVESIAGSDDVGTLSMSSVILGYLRAVFRKAGFAAFGVILASARGLGRLALSESYRPQRFRRVDAEAQLVARGYVANPVQAGLIVDGFVGAGIVRKVYRAGAEWLAFDLDPLAEHLAALDMIADLPDLSAADQLRAQVVDAGGPARVSRGFLSAFDQAVQDARRETQ